MKRQSKAEEALAKQIIITEEEIKALYNEINHRQSKIVALSDVVSNIQTQISQLKAEREKASTNRKP